MHQQMETGNRAKNLPGVSPVGRHDPARRRVWLLVVGVVASTAVAVLCFAKPALSERAALSPGSEAAPPDPPPPSPPAPLPAGGERGGASSIGSKPESPQPESPPSAAPPIPDEPVPLPPKPMPTWSGLDYVPPTTADALEREAFVVAFRLLQEFPNHTDPMGLMGMLHNHLGDAAKAMEFWERCLKHNPNRPDTYRAMGRLAMTQGKYEEAVALARKAMDLNPRLPGTRTILAESLLRLSRPKEAIAALEEEIRAPSEPGQTGWLSGDLCLAGRAYQQLAEYEKAYQSYRKAAEIQPQSVEAHYGLATVCARLGQTDKARQYMEKFQTLKAQGREAHLRRRNRETDAAWVRRILAWTHTEAARIYRGHRRLKEAEEHWQKAAILDPEDVVCRRELALLYERTGRRREALKICKELTQIDPKNAQYHFNLGVLYARTNQIGAALVSAGRALELAPDNAKYRQTYEQIRKAK